jgi:hypothetical protein
MEGILGAADAPGAAGRSFPISARPSTLQPRRTKPLTATLSGKAAVSKSGASCEGGAHKPHRCKYSRSLLTVRMWKAGVRLAHLLEGVG